MTEKLHFEDLTQITAPFGLLDDDTRERLKAWPYGVKFLRHYGDGWGCVEEPTWINGLVYRAKPAPPAPKTKPVYPWSALPDWVQACAVDAEGWAHGFSHAPLGAAQAWILNGFGTRARIDHIHKGYIPGTCDWRDTLEHRPEGV